MDSQIKKMVGKAHSNRSSPISSSESVASISDFFPGNLLSAHLSKRKLPLRPIHDLPVDSSLSVVHCLSRRAVERFPTPSWLAALFWIMISTGKAQFSETYTGMSLQSDSRGRPSVPNVYQHVSELGWHAERETLPPGLRLRGGNRETVMAGHQSAPAFTAPCGLRHCANGRLSAIPAIA
jgi:hypothetical protein